MEQCLACMGKYVWAVATKQDNLWVKWVHSVYIKDNDWWEYTSINGVSLYWAKICDMKNQLKVLFTKVEFYVLAQYKVRKNL